MKAAYFRVLARLDRTRPEAATVTIERSHDLFHVRPYRRRRRFTLPLSTVAALVVQAICRAEAREKIAAKRARRKRI